MPELNSLDREAGPAWGSVLALGVPISAVDMDTAVRGVTALAESPQTRFVCAADVHGVMRAQSLPAHRAAYLAAAMVTPDGKPLEWLGRWRGNTRIRRVAGPDLMLRVCAMSVDRGWSHYFYGGAPGVAEDLALRLSAKFPGLKVAGWECPPFRPVTEAEQQAAIARINDSGAKFVWVGLGCPKQEMWMAANAPAIRSAVLLGVGAAFDFHTGRVGRAPQWMQDAGLEWLHRLWSEPRRLWWRYVVLAPLFVFSILREEVGRRLSRTTADR